MKFPDRKTMKVIPLSAMLVIAAVAFRAPADTARTVGSANGQIELSSVRLGDIIGNSTAAVQIDVARQIAMLWVNYQLLGLAGAAGDSLLSDAVVSDAQWASMAELRFRKYRDSIQGEWTAVTDEEAKQAYEQGEVLGAKQILFSTDSTTTDADRKRLRFLADSVHRILSARYFAPPAVAGQEVDYDDLGAFTPGTMIPVFESTLRSLSFGGISGVIETEFGYHIVYRPPFGQITASVKEAIASERFKAAESTYVRRLEQDYNVVIAPKAVERARVLARAVGVDQGDKEVIATYKGGQVTAARFAEWLDAFPPGTNVVGMAARGPDSLVERVIRRVARSEIELKLADDAGIQISPEEFEGFRHQLFQELNMDWTALRIGPGELEEAGTRTEKERLARERIEDYIDRMVLEQVPYVAVPSSLARALRTKYSARVNENALDEAVSKAIRVRAAMDSVRSATAPVPGSRPEARPTPSGMQTPIQLRVPPPSADK